MTRPARPPSPITGSGSSGGWRGCGGAALSTRPFRRWATWSTGIRRPSPTGSRAPATPDRNLGIYQGLLAQGENPLPPGAVLLRQGAGFPRPGGGSRCQWEEYLASGEGWVENQREACRDLSACYLRQGKGEEAFAPWPKPCAWGRPGGALLRFRRLFLERGDYPAAAFW